jgi:hypothetical protein
MLAAFGISIIGCIVNYVFMIFVPSFAQQQLHIAPSSAFLSTLVAGVSGGAAGDGGHGLAATRPRPRQAGHGGR